LLSQRLSNSTAMAYNGRSQPISPQSSIRMAPQQASYNGRSQPISPQSSIRMAPQQASVRAAPQTHASETAAYTAAATRSLNTSRIVTAQGPQPAVYQAAQPVVYASRSQADVQSGYAQQPVYEQHDDMFTRQVTSYEHGIRTAKDNSVTSSRALQKLMEGNQRFINGTPAPKTFCAEHREALQAHGQRPMATIIGCSDSRCSVEVLFDAIPGDVFVLRNAGNTLTNAEGSMVGSAEYSVCMLGAELIMLLGHTHCGAIGGATKGMLDNKGVKQDRTAKKTCLQTLLGDLEPVAAQAQLELPPGAQADEIAAHAVYVNVFNAIEKLLSYSAPLREKAMDGALEVHAAVYDIVSGKVEFLGQHPRLPLILGSQSGLICRAAPKEQR